METQTKYIITDNIPKLNEHWNYCSNNAFPYITASKRGKYYRVSVDMFCTPYNLTDGGLQEVKKILEEEMNEIPESMKNKRDSYAAYVFSHVYPVQKERIEEICSKLFEVGIKHREFVDEDIERIYKSSNTEK